MDQSCTVVANSWDSTGRPGYSYPGAESVTTDTVAPLGSLFGKDASVLEETDYQLLLLATMFPILGTALVSPVLDSVIEPFGTSPARIGLMISFTTAPAIVLIPVAGVLADRYGRKLVLVGSLLAFGIGGASIVATTDFRVILGLRAIQGVGFAGLVPTITTSIGDMYDGAREATGQGLRMATNGLSGALFPLLAGALVAVAWQLPFLLYGLAIPVAVVVLLRFEEPTTSTGQRADEGGGDGPYLRSLLRVIRQRRALAILVARSLPVVVWIAMFTYNSLIVVRLIGGTAFEAGLLAAVGNFLFAIAGSQAGRLTARVGSRFYPLLVGNVALGGGLAAVFYAPTVPVAILGIAVAGTGFGLTLTLYRSMITNLAPQSLRGGVVSAGASLARIAATATPIAMGVVLGALEPTMGFEAALRIAGLGAAVVGGGGGIVCLLIAHTAPAVRFRPESSVEQ